MDAPISGDIFPARQAIELIDQVDLSLPLVIPPIPAEAAPDNRTAEEHRWLLAEIARLKKERNTYILAHNYAPADIQDVADAVGDSLYLAQKGAESDAEILLEESVLSPLEAGQYCGVSKGGEHPLWSRAGLIPRPRNALFIVGGNRDAVDESLACLEHCPMHSTRQSYCPRL